VLQPLKQKAQAAVDKLTDLPGQKLSGYCLDFVKLPPAPGTLYRIADEKLQQQFAPFARVLHAARTLATEGKLNPDSNPTGYLTAIKQWSMWGRIEKWNAGDFERRFVEYTKKSAADAGREWTKDLEQRVRGLVPNRWRDISAIWAAADGQDDSRVR
jgi:hypothetical protein